MGIQGLTTFVDNHSHLLTDHELHDTKVVIDGNNLFHFLYYHFNIGPQFGGDYDVYATGVRFYFNRLRECNIEPYVVFDGAYPPDDRKLRTSLKRANDKLAAAKLLSKGEVANVIPLLASETFHSVLSELGVKQFTCEFEADNQMTALANALQCPVMSNDSDFYIYDVQHGFILFDYVHLEKHSKTGQSGTVNFIKVQIYFLENFLKNFRGISREKMALFASLMGNDYVSREDLGPFYADTKVMRPCSQKSKTPKRFTLITSLLNWLETMESLPIAIATVVHCFKPEKQETFKSQLELSVNEYLSHASHPLQFDHQNDAQASLEGCKTDEHGRIGGKMLPKWVLDSFQRGHIAVSCMNAVVSNRIILPPHIEDTKVCSSHFCSRKLRQIAYSLLILAADENHSPCITEYDRVDGSIRKVEVPILSPEYNLLCQTQLRQIPHLCPEERLQKLLCFMSISEDMYARLEELVGEKHCLPYLTLIYWVENADPIVMDIHFKSLLLCFMKLISASHEEQVTHVSEDLEDMMPQADRGMENLAGFSKRQKISFYNSSITHAFAQYQSCLQATIYLNQLLMFPLESPNLASYMNGTFLYNMSRNLLNRKSPDMYIQEILGRKSVLFLKFEQIMQLLLESFSSPGRLGSNTMPSGQKKSKKKKASGQKKARENQSDTDSSQEDSGVSNGGVQVQCSTRNMFDMLSIE